MRNEADNLPRLAESLAAQTVPLAEWVIVDNGSTDETVEVVADLSRAHSWIRLMEIPGEVRPMRGSLSIRAFNEGYASLGATPSYLSNIDADVSLPPTYFETILRRIDADPQVGIATGLCHEVSDGQWRPVHVTMPFLRGALRTYRMACFQDVGPLEERLGWDSIDCISARVAGWKTLLVADLPYWHHRPTGHRDKSHWHGWRLEGELAYYMWYRPSYLAVRTAFRGARDPSALGMIDGYLRAALARRPRHPKPAFREFVRAHQRLREIPRRRGEVLGLTPREH